MEDEELKGTEKEWMVREERRKKMNNNAKKG